MYMKTLTNYLLFLGAICSAAGISYGLYNEKTRPYVIIFILLSWAVMIMEIKRAPLEKTSD